MSTSDTLKTAASGQTEPGTMSAASVTDEHIKAALGELDPANDAHWTSDGKPAMDAVNALLTAAITRKRLDEVAPEFVRPENVLNAGSEELSDESLEEIDLSNPDALSPETRLAALELVVDRLASDLAFLRKQFGWPTKDS